MENTLQMKDKERGFMEYDRQDAPYRPVIERLKDYDAVELPLGEFEIRRQAARCMDCGVPFCHASQAGCPLNNIPPEFNSLVYEGKWHEALEILHSTNCYPEFTGRVCPAPCESACVLGINDDPVNICKIELAIIEEGWGRGYVKPRVPEKRRGEKIAVLGSGPAGLACADILNQAGFSVTVYETDVQPGGILRYGIPDFKLEKWVIDRRLRLMEEEGVVFECGVKGGEDVSQRYLAGRFDAIVIAGGARTPRDLDVPGRELNNIHFAMDFLTQQNKRIAGEPIAGDDISAENKRVVVIGGGDTGSDCVGTANRQGAVSVTQFEILPKPPAERSPDTPWPLWPKKLRTSSSHKEGVERRWSIITKKFTGDKEGNVKGLHCAEVEWVQDEDSVGKACPREIEGAEFTINADLILLAMGFVGPAETKLVEGLELDRDQRGFLKRDENWMTSKEGVFVSGDMWRGASLVVHAIADGMRCAEKVAKYFEDN